MTPEEAPIPALARLFRRQRPRGLRPELPAAVPGSTVQQVSGQWGEIPLPLASSSAVMGLPAANRAVLLISNAVASMAPMEMWGADGYKADATPAVLTRPNATFQTFDFFQMATQMAVMRGNFLALKADFDAGGYPQQLSPVPTGFWWAYYDGAGYLVYAVRGDIFSADEVVHVRANCAPNSPMGIGVVEQFRRAIGHALDQQNFAADTYRSGSVPAGIIDLDLPEVDQDQADLVQSQWLTNHASGARAPAVLPNTMHFNPIQWSPEDLQFLEARLFSVSEVAHMFNLDPTDLGAAFPGDSMTYSNIEQRQTQRIVDSYGPWMRRFEDAWSDLVPATNLAKLVPQNLLRTDSKTRAEVRQLEIANETLSPAEARQEDGRRPLPKPPAPAPAAVPGAPVVGADGKPVPGATGEPAPGVGGGPSTPVEVPDDPNITVTPVKVKI